MRFISDDSSNSLYRTRVFLNHFSILDLLSEYIYLSAIDISVTSCRQSRFESEDFFFSAHRIQLYRTVSLSPSFTRVVVQYDGAVYRNIIDSFFCVNRPFPV